MGKLRSRQRIKPQNRGAKADDVDLDEMLERIDGRLAATNQSARAAGKAAGLSLDVIHTMRKQVAKGLVKRVHIGTMEKLAVPLRTTAEWLMYGKGPDEARLTAHPARALDEAAEQKARKDRAKRHAGLEANEHLAPTIWREEAPNIILGSHHGLSVIPADPRLSAATQFAMRVDDQSINEVARPGDVLIVAGGQMPKDGDIVVVERIRAGLHELSARRFSGDQDKFALAFASQDQKFAGQKPLAVKGGRDQDTEVKIHGVVLGAHRVLGIPE